MKSVSTKYVFSAHAFRWLNLACVVRCAHYIVIMITRCHRHTQTPLIKYFCCRCFYSFSVTIFGLSVKNSNGPLYFSSLFVVVRVRSIAYTSYNSFVVIVVVFCGVRNFPLIYIYWFLYSAYRLHITTNAHQVIFT